jgi:hypothetical protein
LSWRLVGELDQERHRDDRDAFFFDRNVYISIERLAFACHGQASILDEYGR